MQWGKIITGLALSLLIRCALWLEEPSMVEEIALLISLMQNFRVLHRNAIFHIELWAHQNNFMQLKCDSTVESNW